MMLRQSIKATGANWRTLAHFRCLRSAPVSPPLGGQLERRTSTLRQSQISTGADLKEKLRDFAAAFSVVRLSKHPDKTLCFVDSDLSGATDL